MKFVKIPYEVMEGEIENTWQPKIEPSRSNVIHLPRQTDYQNPTIPSAKERYARCQKLKQEGWIIGVEVIRVMHMTEAMLANKYAVGRFERFLFHVWPGYSTYMPLLVKFDTGKNSDQSFPFFPHELEFYEKAKETVRLQTQRARESTLQERVMADILAQRQGVLPFRQRTLYEGD